MPGIAKFDTWQNNAGTNNQTILQCRYAKLNTSTVISTLTYTFVWNFPLITRTQPNSRFLILLNVQCGYTTSVAGNPDSENPSLAIYRNGTAIDQGTTLDGYSQSFWGCDVPWTGGGTYAGGYDSQNKCFNYSEVPAGNLGDAFQYSLWARGNPFSINSRSVAQSDWNQSAVTIMEIAQ
jgi:hypothetical protein